MAKGHSNPVRLGGGPLKLVDFRLGIINKDGIANGFGERLDIPDESGFIVASRTEMSGRVGGPSESVDDAGVSAEFGSRNRRNADIEDDGFAGIHAHGGEIVVVLSVPANAEKRARC